MKHTTFKIGDWVAWDRPWVRDFLSVIDERPIVKEDMIIPKVGNVLVWAKSTNAFDDSGRGQVVGMTLKQNGVAAHRSWSLDGCDDEPFRCTSTIWLYAVREGTSNAPVFVAEEGLRVTWPFELPFRKVRKS